MRLQADEGSADAHLAAVATGADMESLADIVLSIEVDAERRGALLVAIQGWPPAERAERVDSFVKALTARGESIQAEGKAAFERGEPTTGAEKKLWAIVDMTVLSTSFMPQFARHSVLALVYRTSLILLLVHAAILSFIWRDRLA